MSEDKSLQLIMATRRALAPLPLTERMAVVQSLMHWVAKGVADEIPRSYAETIEQLTKVALEMRDQEEAESN